MHTECVFFPVAILLSSSLLVSFVFLTGERRAFEFGGFVLLPGLFPSPCPQTVRLKLIYFRPSDSDLQSWSKPCLLCDLLSED